MSHLPRNFFLRLMLGVLGMLLFVAVVIAAAGWVLICHFEWAQKSIGIERARRLYCWCSLVAAQILPGDADADAYRDGLEVIFDSDPRNAQSRPTLGVHAIGFPRQIFFCGERTPTSFAMGPFHVDLPFPRGCRVKVTADDAILLGKGDVGQASKGPLLVVASENGEVEFDILAMTTAKKLSVTFAHADTGTVIEICSVTIAGWRNPPVAISFPDWYGGSTAHAPDPTTRIAQELQYIDWQPAVGEVAGYVIERRRRVDGKAWVPLGLYESHNRSGFLQGPKFWSPSDRFGEFEFRVTPVSAAHP